MRKTHRNRRNNSSISQGIRTITPSSSFIQSQIRTATTRTRTSASTSDLPPVQSSPLSNTRFSNRIPYSPNRSGSDSISEVRLRKQRGGLNQKLTSHQQYYQPKLSSSSSSIRSTGTTGNEQLDTQQILLNRLLEAGLKTDSDQLTRPIRLPNRDKSSTGRTDTGQNTRTSSINQSNLSHFSTPNRSNHNHNHNQNHNHRLSLNWEEQDGTARVIDSSAKNRSSSPYISNQGRNPSGRLETGKSDSASSIRSRSLLVTAEIESVGRVAIKEEELIDKLGREAALLAIGRGSSSSRATIMSHNHRKRKWECDGSDENLGQAEEVVGLGGSRPKTDLKIGKWLSELDDDDDDDDEEEEEEEEEDQMSEDETLHQQLYQSPNQQHQLLQAFYDSLPKQVNPAQLSETGNEDLEKATQFWNHLSSSITLLPPSSTSYHSASYPNNTLFGSSYQDQELIYSSLPSSEANEEDQVLSEALEVRQSVNPLPDWFNYETPDSNDDLFVQSPSGLSSSHLTPTCETEIEIYNDPSEQPLIHQSKNSISKRYSPFVADQPRSATPPPKILLHNHQGPQMTSSIFKYGCNPDQALSLAPSPPRTLFPEQSITQQSELLGVQGSIKRSLERVTSHKHQQQQLREDGRENGEIKFLGYRKCSSNGSVRNQLSSDFSPCSPLRPSQAINHQNHQSTNSHNTRRHQPIYSSDTNLQHCYQNSDEQENLCVSLGGKEDLVDQRRNFNEQNTLRFLKEESVEGEVKFGFKDVDEFRGVSIGLFEGNIGEVVTLKDEEYFKLNF